MNESFVQLWSRRLIVPLAAAFFVIMFLDWHEASVGTAGVISVHGLSSAWNGWGAIAGFAAGALLLWQWLCFVGAEVSKRLSASVVTASLALVTLVFTVVEFLSGSASVSVASVVTVTTAERWPAYVGLTLAALIAFAGLVQLERPVERHGGRLGLGAR